MRPRSLIVMLLLAALGAVVCFWAIGRSERGAGPEKNSSARVPSSPQVPSPTGFSPQQRAAPVAAAVPLPTASRVFGAMWKTAKGAEMAEFRDWTERYLASAPAERAGLIAEGVARARARRPVMAEMIRADPEQALANAVPIMVRKQLPEEVDALLEKRVSGPGQLALRGVTPAPEIPVTETTYRVASVNGEEYRAYTYGRRASAGTIERASIHGVALDGAIAVSDSPVRVLEPGETAESKPIEPVCVVSGKQTPISSDTPLNLPTADPAHTPVAVEVNGRIQISCEAAHVKLMTEEVLAEELANEDQNLAADGGQGSSTVVGRPTSAWTHGPKKVLIIIVDFSDKPGTPVDPYDGQSITATYVLDRFNAAGGVKDFYEQNSFSATTLTITSSDVTGVLRMPKTATYYAQAGANTELHSDARAAATTAGFNPNNYDRVGVVFAYLGNITGSSITYAGLANVIGHDFWINGYFYFPAVAHEIGHNYGLNHANLWQVSDGNPISNNGTSTEYGDTFDVMGSGSGFDSHFTHWNKSILQWIPDTAVTTVTTAGTYRVYKFDAQGANLANTLALKIVRDGTRDYWVGHRRATTNAALDNGAYILWGYTDNRQGNLLDLATPGTNVSDCALQLGNTFNDAGAGITFTTLDRGGTGNDEYLDMQIGFSPHISFSDTVYIVDERSGTAQVTLVRGGSAAGAVSVQYATVPGTATSPGDYTATSGTMSWASGDMSPKVVTIPIVADSVKETSEDFNVQLSNPTGGAVADPSPATVRIVDAGVADSSFSADFTDNTVNQVIVEPDGHVLACGYFDLVETTGYVIYNRGGICRYSAAGAVDASYSAGGGATGGQAIVYGMARQPDGKVIIGGDFTTVDTTARLNIARLNTDGSVDTTFNPGTGANFPVHAVLVQANGKIVIGGEFTSYNGTARKYLARLNADGSLDTGFVGVTGTTGFAGSGFWVDALAMQTDGKILAAGNFYLGGSTTNPPQFKCGICRVTTTGVLDPAFTGVTYGATDSSSTSTLKTVRQVAVQPGGNIIIAGDFTAFNGTPMGRIARLTSTGALDGTFTGTTDGEVDALMIQPDGNMLIGGTFTKVNNATMAGIGRLTASGARDTTFAPPSGPSATVNSFAMGADGRVVFGGDYGNYQSQPNPGPLFRLIPGIAGLPGTVQLSAATATGVEGSSVSLKVSRTGGSTGALTVGYATVAGTADTTDYTATSNGTLTWADGDTADKTLTIPITGDSVPDDGEIFYLNLGQALLDSPPLGATQQTTITIREGFSSWQKAKFTSTELSQPSVSGDLADPDHDGLANLLEYAFGLAPKTPNGAGGRPSLGTTTVNGSDYLTLSFRRLVPAAPDLTYTVENASSANGQWGTTPVQVGSAVSNGDGTETVTFRDDTPIGTGQRFLRLQVDKAP